METIFFLSQKELNLEDIGRLAELHGWRVSERPAPDPRLTPSLEVSVPPNYRWDFSEIQVGDLSWSELEPGTQGAIQRSGSKTVLSIAFRVATLRELLASLTELDPDGQVGVDEKQGLTMWPVAERTRVLQHFRLL
jgi:hypothetical protein